MDNGLPGNTPTDPNFPPKEPHDQERRPVAFRDVDWQWQELLIGLAPLVGVRLLNGWATGQELSPAVRQVLFLLNCLGSVWMLVYPLWLIHRKHVRLARFSIRSVVVEAALSIPAILLIWMVLIPMLTIWTKVAGGELPVNPLEPAAQAGALRFIAIYTLFAAIVGPITEEVFFRGMLYNGLRMRIHPLAAAILQGAVFGLVHSFGYVHSAAAAFLGLALAAVYELRRTLLAPIFVHFLQNLTAGVITFLMALNLANAPVLGIQAKAQDGGCLLLEITPGSGADEAGLQANDVITSVDGTPVANVQGITAIVRQKEAGDRIQVESVRDGDVRRVEVILKPR